MTKQIVRIFIAILTLAGTAHAAEPLRWKFATGDKIVFATEQQMKIELNGFDGPIVSDLGQQPEMTLQVERVSENSDAVLVGKFNRMRSTIRGTGAETNEYDSAAEEAPIGMAAMLAPTYEALIAGEYRITVSPRGEVGEMQIPEEVRSRLENSPGGDATGVESTIASFKATIAQAFIPLPGDAPSVGQFWTSSFAVSIPGTKSATAATEYKFDGTKQVDGATCAVIRPALTLQLVGDDNLQPTIKNQTTKGEILFDASAGRLRSIKLNYHAAIDITSGGKTYGGAIEQRVSVRTVESE